MVLLAIIPILGNLISIGFCLAPIPALQKAGKAGNIHQFSYAALFSTLLNQYIWWVYGFLRGISGIIIGNGMTVPLSLLTVLIYHHYDKSLVSYLTRYITIFLLLTIFSVTIISVDTLGYLCIAINIYSYLAPLEQMKPVLKSKDARFIDATTTAIGLLNSGLWGWYGILLGDLPMIIPNILGIALGSLQLLLVAWANNKVPDQFIVVNALKGLYSIKEL